jgi:hypothetical protein
MQPLRHWPVTSIRPGLDRRVPSAGTCDRHAPGTRAVICRLDQALRARWAAGGIFWAKSGLFVKSDSVPFCTETALIFQKILRANSDSGAARDMHW